MEEELNYNVLYTVKRKETERPFKVRKDLLLSQVKHLKKQMFRYAYLAEFSNPLGDVERRANLP